MAPKAARQLVTDAASWRPFRGAYKGRIMIARRGEGMERPGYKRQLLIDDHASVGRPTISFLNVRLVKGISRAQSLVECNPSMELCVGTDREV